MKKLYAYSFWREISEKLYAYSYEKALAEISSVHDRK